MIPRWVRVIPRWARWRLAALPFVLGLCAVLYYWAGITNWLVFLVTGLLCSALMVIYAELR